MCPAGLLSPTPLQENCSLTIQYQTGITGHQPFSSCPRQDLKFQRKSTKTELGLFSPPQAAFKPPLPHGLYHPSILSHLGICCPCSVPVLASQAGRALSHSAEPVLSKERNSFLYSNILSAAGRWVACLKAIMPANWSRVSMSGSSGLCVELPLALPSGMKD